MAPFRLYWGSMVRPAVWTSLAADPLRPSASITEVALALSSSSAALAVGSVTVIPTETVRRFGLPMAKPVPWTVSFDAEPPQVALAAAAAGGEDKPTATSTPAVI